MTPAAPTDDFDAVQAVLGEARTLRMVRRLGGARIRIPAIALPRTRLVRELGAEAAALLCEHFGGEVLYIPLYRSGMRDVASAIRGFDPGMVSDDAVAQAVGCSVEYVRQIRHRLPRRSGNRARAHVRSS